MKVRDRKKRKQKHKRDREVADPYAELVARAAKLKLMELPEEDRAFALEVLEDAISGEGSKLDAIYKIDYRRKPVDIEQFLDDPYYMGNLLYEDPSEPSLWPVWRDELLDVFSDAPNTKYQEWILGGGIGVGKTSIVVIAIVYLIYIISCLRKPHKHFGLMSNMMLVFGVYSVTKTLAQDVAYGKIREYLLHIPYFKRKYPILERIVKDTRFKKNGRIRVLTGSKQFHTLGLDLYTFLLDEGNFFQQQSARNRSKITRAQEEATEAYKLYHQAHSRIVSRFMTAGGGFPGMVFMVSSKSSELAFLEEHINNRKTLIEKGIVKLSEFAIWDVKPKRLYALPKFKVEVGDETYCSRVLRPDDVARDLNKVIDVPGEYFDDFSLNVEQALRDHAGVSTIGTTSLIRDREAINRCVTDAFEHPFHRQSIVLDYRGRSAIENYFNPEAVFAIRQSKRLPIHHPRAVRFGHVDLALRGDAASIVIGHVAGMSRIKRMREDASFYYDDQPEVWIDLMLQIVPPGGAGEISIQKIRSFLIYLRATGLPLHFISTDGYQSADLHQILRTLERPFTTRLFSVDRTDEPYCFLRNAIYEDRLRYYHYAPFLKEVRNLIHDLDARKVDHPQKFPDGSKGAKDVADGVAAVVTQCIETPSIQVSLAGDEPVILLSGAERNVEISYDISPELAHALEMELKRRERRRG